MGIKKAALARLFLFSTLKSEVFFNKHEHNSCNRGPNQQGPTAFPHSPLSVPRDNANYHSYFVINILREQENKQYGDDCG